MEDNNDVKYNLTGKKIIPLNAPIGFANTTPPTTLPFQAVEKGQSVSEGLCAGQGMPYYNEDGTVNPNAVATTLKMMLDMYNTISQPVALLSMGAIPEWSQSVRDNNDGYPKDFIIREYDTTGFWVYYQSLIDNNISPKPTLASHVGWAVIYSYQTGGTNGTTIKDIGNLFCATSLAFAFEDETKNLVMGKLYAFEDAFPLQYFKMCYVGQKSVVITSGNFRFRENVQSLEFDLNDLTDSYKLQSIQSINVTWGSFSGSIGDLGILTATVVGNMKIIVETSKNPQPSTEQYFYITIHAQLR